ncbi:MAG TPA: hypothetical protein VNJ70_15915 [Thermoanaerobaculia bacterium]|nr:hypothetical protein [Thermoanaerobaculia bacterium]
MTEPKRLRLLFGLLGVLLVVLALRVAGLGGGEDDPPPAAAAARPAIDDPDALPAPRPGTVRRARPAGGEEDDAPPDEVVDLRLDLLEREPRSYRPGRNPWTFPPPPPPPEPPKPKPPSAAELARQQAEAERIALAQAAAAEAARLEALKPKPPPFTMKYVGSFGPAGRRLAVFSNGKEIINARQGEVLQGKFVVARIGYESVDIQFVGFPAEPPLRLAIGHQ